MNRDVLSAPPTAEPDRGNGWNLVLALLSSFAFIAATAAILWREDRSVRSLENAAQLVQGAVSKRLEAIRESVVKLRTSSLQSILVMDIAPFTRQFGTDDLSNAYQARKDDLCGLAVCDSALQPLRVKLGSEAHGDELPVHAQYIDSGRSHFGLCRPLAQGGVGSGTFGYLVQVHGGYFIAFVGWERLARLFDAACRARLPEIGRARVRLRWPFAALKSTSPGDDTSVGTAETEPARLRVLATASSHPSDCCVAWPAGTVARGEQWAQHTALSVEHPMGWRIEMLPERPNQARRWILIAILTFSAACCAWFGGRYIRRSAWARQAKRSRDQALVDATRRFAHDIRNPLMPIRDRALFLQETVHDRTATIEEIESNLSAVLRLCDRVEDVVQQHVDYCDLWAANRGGAVELLQPEAVDLGELFEEEAQSFATGSVRLDAQSVALPVVADVATMRRVAQNVCKNAAQAMEGGGTLTLRGSVADSAGTRVAVIRIADTGDGVAPDDLDRVFEPQFTRRARGSGLGLPICREIVRLHEGSITLENRPEGGAIVTVSIPLATNTIPLATTGDGSVSNSRVDV